MINDKKLYKSIEKFSNLENIKDSVTDVMVKFII